MNSQLSYRKGDRIGGRFLVHQALMGGMGEVYLCLDLKEDQPIALKTFRQYYMSSPRVRELFKKEVDTWVALEKHPHIVTCHAMDMIENRPFMILEWIAGDEERGPDLRGWLQRRPLLPRMALQFTIQILCGLMHAQKKIPGIVHRDLKPENVLVTKDHVAKITDFGLTAIAVQAELSISADPQDPTKTISVPQAGGAVGTPAYMAPEQWMGGELDERTDVYAIGCMLYEMLTGRLPFTATSPNELRHHHLKSEIPPLPQLDNLPDGFDKKLLRYVLAKKPSQRIPAQTLLNILLMQYQIYFGAQPRACIESPHEFSSQEYANRGYTRELLKQYPRALADYTQAIQMDSTVARFYAGRATAYCGLGEFEKAVEDFSKAVEIDSNDASFYAGRGASYMRLKRFDKAMEDFNHAIEINPSLCATYHNRGRLYEICGQTDKALADYSCALTLNPSIAETLKQRANLYDEMKCYEEAVSDYTRAIQLDPTDSTLYCNRGVTFFKMKRYEEASADYDRAIELNPQDAQAWYNKGTELGNTGNLQEALKCFQAANRLGFPQAPQAMEKLQSMLTNPVPVSPAGSSQAAKWFELGMAAGRAEEWHTALSCFEKALELDPDNAEAWYSKAVTLAGLGREDEGVACYDRALQLNAENAEAWYNKGAISGNSGQFHEALIYFEKALDLGFGPATKAVEACRRKLGMY